MRDFYMFLFIGLVAAISLKTKNRFYYNFTKKKPNYWSETFKRMEWVTFQKVSEELIE